MAGRNSLCDLQSENCSTFTVFGQDFVSSPELGCRVRQISVEQEDSANWRYLTDSVECEALYVEETTVRCSLAQSLLDKMKSSEARPSLTLEVEITNSGTVWSSGIFLTVYNSSCQLCSEQSSPLRPKTCREREDICR